MPVCLNLYRFRKWTDTDMRLVSLESASPEGDHWGIIFPKSDQWPNYRSEILRH